MSTEFKVGDHAGWNSEAGRVSGRITKIHTKNFQYKDHHRTQQLQQDLTTIIGHLPDAHDPDPENPDEPDQSSATLHLTTPD